MNYHSILMFLFFITAKHTNSINLCTHIQIKIPFVSTIEQFVLIDLKNHTFDVTGDGFYNFPICKNNKFTLNSKNQVLLDESNITPCVKSMMQKNKFSIKNNIVTGQTFLGPIKIRPFAVYDEKRQQLTIVVDNLPIINRQKIVFRPC